MSRSFRLFLTVRAAAYAAVAVSALLVACGGGGDDDAPAAAAPTSPAASIASGGATNASAGGRATTAAPTTPAGALDACSLISKADAERALGEPVNAGEGEQRRNNASTCTYNSVGNYGAHVVFIYAGRGPNERPAYDLAKRTLSRPEALSGLGDDAFAINLDALVTQVHVVKGDVYFTVAITHLTAGDRAARTRALAAAVLAKL